MFSAQLAAAPPLLRVEDDAGSGCVSSPVATSCYSNGPELIGRWSDDDEGEG